MAVQGAFSEKDYREHAAFRCALHEFLHRSEERARQYGLTPQHYVLLLTIRGHTMYPNVTIGSIAEAVKLRQSSTSLLVDRCVRAGHLVRSEDPSDRRRALISLSDRGQHLLDDIMEANRKELGQLEGSLFGLEMRDAIRYTGDRGAEA